MVLFTNLPPPAEGIRSEETNVSVYIDGKDYGNGTLYIAESCVAWQKDNDGLGFSLQYPGISLHAISRDLRAFPQECLYLMLDGKLPDNDASADTEEQEDEETSISEIRFVPANKTSLDPMYAAMCACQALHPDAEDFDSDEDGEFDNDDDDDDDDDDDEDEEEEEQEGVEAAMPHLTAEGRNRLARFEAMLETGQGDTLVLTNGNHMQRTHTAAMGDNTEPMDLGQFQDADDME